MSLSYDWATSVPQYDWIRASTTLQGQNQFGEVTWGFLKVRTKVILTSVNLEMDEVDEGKWSPYSARIGGAHVYLDGQDLIAQCACVSNPHGDDMAWALISARSRSYLTRFMGLLLRSTGRPREYYRIGVFKIPSSNGPISWDTETIEII